VVRGGGLCFWVVCVLAMAGPGGVEHDDGGQDVGYERWASSRKCLEASDTASAHEGTAVRSTAYMTRAYGKAALRESGYQHSALFEQIHHGRRKESGCSAGVPAAFVLLSQTREDVL